MNDKYSTTEGKTSEKLSDEAMLSAQWKNIDWHKAEREVNRLQIRIVKATQQKDYNAVKRLQYLLTHSHNTTSFEERLKAKVCEVCGCTDSDSYEIHHVNKVKNLKGKADWEKVMLAKRRKTIVVCHKCHMRIHHGTKTE